MDPYQENFQQQEPGQEPGVPLLEVQEHHLQPHVSQHMHGHGHYRYNSGVDMTELVEILDASFCWKSKEDVPSMSVPALTIAPASFTAVIGPYVLFLFSFACFISLLTKSVSARANPPSSKAS